MNATIYILQNPSLLMNLFAGELPAVALFFGLAHLVLRKQIEVVIRPWVALAYIVAPTLFLALSGWGVRAEKYGDGVKLLVPLILSALSCAALYYQEWKRKQHKTSSSGAVDTPSQVASAQPQLDTPEPQVESAEVQIEVAKPQLAKKPAPTSNNGQATGWSSHLVTMLSAAVVGGIFILFIYYVSGGAPNYIVEDAGEYGYKETKKGAANQSVKLFRYSGIHNGKHQVYVNNDRGHIDAALECAVPCKAIKEMVYMNVDRYDNKPRRQGMFVSKRFIPADTDSVEARVMEDAIKGHLKAQPLNPTTLKFYQVPIETAMEGVPIRPIFSEDWIAFEYMAGRADPPALSSSSKASQPDNATPIDKTSEPANPGNTAKTETARQADKTFHPDSSGKAKAHEATKPAEKEVTPEMKLTAAHPDWLTIIKTDQFKYWRDNVIPDGKELMASEDADYLIRRLTAFKEWKRKQGR